MVWAGFVWYCVFTRHGVQRCRSFIAKCDLLTSLDGEYITAVPELYSNPPRQFQVQVACRQAQNRAYLCTGPANLFIRVCGVCGGWCVAVCGFEGVGVGYWQCVGVCECW